MATAVRNDPPPVEQPPVTYALTLSEREAETLRSPLGNNVNGPGGGPRGVADSIFYALCDAGVRVPPARFTGTVTGRPTW